jgi:predicted RNA-binding protein with PUA-like domain
MNYWLLKTEPQVYSWADMEKDGRTFWDGVHNFQARNYLRQMKKGDLAFFYHSGDERRIVGIVQIVREAYPDIEDGQWSWVDVQKWSKVRRAVSLEELKKEPTLEGMNLFRQGRLSVVALTEKEWTFVKSLVE